MQILFLEGGYDEETQTKFLNVIASESRRMARLVTDLLTLSRYDSNKKKTRKETFDLGDLVKRCQEKLAIEIKKKGHKVTSFVTADVPPVYADKDDIERVVLNILTNSIKYTPDNGEIKIYVGFVYNDAYIKIFDNGIGIPEDDLSRIFLKDFIGLIRLVLEKWEVLVWGFLLLKKFWIKMVEVLILKVKLERVQRL